MAKYWDPNRGCHSKNRYSDKVHALGVADKVYNERQVKVRPYECPYCYGFHLTKQPLP